MRLYEQLKNFRITINSCITEFEDVYDKLKVRGDPRPLQVLFPIAYRRLIDYTEQSQTTDRKLLTFMGQYLTTRNPELSQYFISKEQRESLESMRELLTKHMEGKQ